MLTLAKDNDNDSVCYNYPNKNIYPLSSSIYLWIDCLSKLINTFVKVDLACFGNKKKSKLPFN